MEGGRTPFVTRWPGQSFFKSVSSSTPSRRSGLKGRGDEVRRMVALLRMLSYLTSVGEGLSEPDCRRQLHVLLRICLPCAQGDGSCSSRSWTGWYALD
jgi:hypothetical protein